MPRRKSCNLPIELANLLLVVDALQSSGSHRTVECPSAIQNAGEFVAQANPCVDRPDQRTHGESNDGSQDRIEHAQPRHVPRLSLTAEDQDQGRGESGSGERGMQRGQVAK